MSRIRFVLAFLLTLFTLAPVSAGPGGLFVRKPKVDEAKARALVETLKSDPDEKKRKAAADQLGGADTRVSPDVAPALVGALRRDASAAVRVEAAEALRQLGDVFPQAGAALEEAVESDPAPVVRLAAKRALWEYHLNGYRTAKGPDGSAGQTIEPPIASPAGPTGTRPAVAFVPAPPAPVQLPPVPAAPVPQLPPVASAPAPQSGPRMFWPNLLPGPRNAVRAALNLGPPPLLNLTGEPPIAKPTVVPPVTVGTRPLTTPEPPLRLPPTTTSLSPSLPEYTPTLPPFQPDLPPVVTPPGAPPLLVPKITAPPK